MKLALIFVIGFVALSSQQQLQKRLIWMNAPPRSYYRHNIPASPPFYGKSSPMMYHRLDDESFNPLGRYNHQQKPLGSRYYHQPAVHNQQTPAAAFFAPPLQVNFNKISLIHVHINLLVFDYTRMILDNSMEWLTNTTPLQMTTNKNES